MATPNAMRESEAPADDCTKLVRAQSMPPTFAPPLVIRFGAFGDMVLLTPLLRLLHRRYGQPCRVLGSGGWLEPLFAGHPDADPTLRLASRKRPYWLDPSQRHLAVAARAHSGRPLRVRES